MNKLITTLASVLLFPCVAFLSHPLSAPTCWKSFWWSRGFWIPPYPTPLPLYALLTVLIVWTWRSNFRLAAAINTLTLCGAVFVIQGMPLTRHGHPGAVKGNLGMVRSALSIYYGDTEGNYPTSLEVLTVNGKYLKEIPKTRDIEHVSSNEVTYTSNSTPTDSGGWLYNNNPTDPNHGVLWINCTHTNSSGSAWTTY